MIVCGETMIVAECDDSRFAYCFAYRYCFCPEETIHGLLFIRYERMSSVHLQNRSFGTVLIRFRVASFLFLSIFDRSLVVSCDEWYFCYVVFLLFWAGVVFFFFIGVHSSPFVLVIWRACCMIFNCAFLHSSMIHFFVRWFRFIWCWFGFSFDWNNFMWTWKLRENVKNE